MSAAPSPLLFRIKFMLIKLLKIDMTMQRQFYFQPLEILHVALLQAVDRCMCHLPLKKE